MKIKLNVKPYGAIEAQLFNSISLLHEAGYEFEKIVRDKVGIEYQLFVRYLKIEGQPLPTIRITFAVIPCNKFDF